MSINETAFLKALTTLANSGYSEELLKTINRRLLDGTINKDSAESLFLSLYSCSEILSEPVCQKYSEVNLDEEIRRYSLYEIISYMGVDKNINPKLYNRIKSNFSYAVKTGLLSSNSSSKRAQYDLIEIRRYLFTHYSDYIKTFDDNTKGLREGF